MLAIDDVRPVCILARPAPEADYGLVGSKVSAIARAVPSFGLRMNGALISIRGSRQVRLSQVLAVLKSQLVVTWPRILACSSPVQVALACSSTAISSSLNDEGAIPAILGWSTFQAPWKNTNAVFIGGAPAYR